MLDLIRNGLPARPGPEFRLLAACSWRPQAPMEADQAGRIAALLGGGIDWAVFIALVDRHRIAGLVQANLAGWGEQVPGEVRTALVDRARKAAMVSLQHAAELVRLHRLLGADGIDLLPLKGPMLSLRLYGNPALRSLRDIDLMVHPGDLDRADVLLRSAGYRRTEPQGEPSPKMMRAYQERVHHFCYHHDGRGIELELHWRFKEWSPAQVAQLWAHSPELPALGSSLRQPEDDILLLLLCEHGADHRWFRLKWLSDVAMLLAGRGPEAWIPLLDRADGFGMKPGLAQAMLLCHSLYGVDWPEPVGKRLRAVPKAEWLALKAMGSILEPAEIGQGSPLVTLWSNFRYRRALGCSRSLLGHLDFVGILPADGEMLRLPDRLFFLYYLLRPVSWAWRHRPWNRPKAKRTVRDRPDRA